MRVTAGTKLILGVAAVLALLGGLAWMLRDAGPPPPPEIVFSPAPDTIPLLPQEEAVGLCALSRTSGALEGRIVGVTRPTGDTPARYVVQTLDGSERRIHLRAEAVMLDLCERALQASPQAEPIRVQPDGR